jgi:two-component system response regulator MtrA
MTNHFSKRVLVVDDDAEMRHLFGLLLSGQGCQVVSCATGTEALSLYRKSPFDVVVIELLMAEHDGFETLMKLKREPSSPRIMVTTRSSWTAADIFFKMAKQLGANETLAKPFAADQFIQTVQKLLAA